MDRAIELDEVELTAHGTDVGRRLEALGYVEITGEHLARPLAAGREAAEWYERPEYEWDE